MQSLVILLTFLLHPGDLGLTGILILLLAFFAIIGLPVAIIVFIIYKVSKKHR